MRGMTGKILIMRGSRQVHPNVGGSQIPTKKNLGVERRQSPCSCPIFLSTFPLQSLRQYSVELAEFWTPSFQKTQLLVKAGDLPSLDLGR